MCPRKLLRNALVYSVMQIAPGPLGAEPAPEAADLLRQADRARGAIAGGVTWEATVDTVEDDAANKIDYQIKVKGDDALVEATGPARNKGELMLFNDRNLWFFKPGIKKPVSISPRQKLLGQAANGDIASTNYYRDYDGKVVGEEPINGKNCWRLDLKAKAKNVTYDGIRYWIDQKDRLGVKAEFLTVGGDVFKSATFDYSNEMQLDGKKMPFISKMTIVDALKKTNQTTINYRNPKAAAFPDAIFNINNLVR